MEKDKILEAYEMFLEEEWAERMIDDILYSDELNEKWKKKVKIQATGEHAGKSVKQLRKEICAMKGSKNFDREKFSELLFALRAKEGWKKGAGAAKLPC